MKDQPLGYGVDDEQEEQHADAEEQVVERARDEGLAEFPSLADERGDVQAEVEERDDRTEVAACAPFPRRR